MLGVFMQDISLSDLPYTNELMLRFLDKAENAYRNGKIQSLVILGDREIAKYPELAETIRQYFASRWNS
jgi:vancomycin permeability regulator SanA